MLGFRPNLNPNKGSKSQNKICQLTSIFEEFDAIDIVYRYK